MNEIDELVSKLPLSADWYICILPGESGKFNLLMDGLTAKEIAKVLYRAADAIVEEYIPPEMPMIKGLNS